MGNIPPFHNALTTLSQKKKRDVKLYIVINRLVLFIECLIHETVVQYFLSWDFIETVLDVQ